MDVSSQSLVSAALSQSAAQASQQLQVSVLKKALDVEAAGALGLLAAVTTPAAGVAGVGELPLATDGSLGTQLNAMA